jgi:hypothetical protein
VEHEQEKGGNRNMNKGNEKQRDTSRQGHLGTKHTTREEWKNREEKNQRKTRDI